MSTRPGGASLIPNSAPDRTRICAAAFLSDSTHMHLWQKRVNALWLARHVDSLEARFAGRVAIIDQPNRQRSLVEICCHDRSEVLALRKEFGGTNTAIPRDWARVFARNSARKPLAIGERLIVQSESSTASRRSLSPRVLVIPAAAAFGTGEHATTAMCLRMLERLSRRKANGWSLFDAGTGTGILAFAARIFGAGKIVAIDFDERAIAVAQQNARANRLTDLDFRVADAVRFNARHKFDFITANLFSELLIAALPNFTRQLKLDGRLILSGILRPQEKSVARALRAAGFTIPETRRRGKWIALVAARAPEKAIDG